MKNKLIVGVISFFALFGIVRAESELLSETVKNYLGQESVYGGMYRYQGTGESTINNYICFGTSDSDECKSDQNKYMYRILGVDVNTNEVKLIKKEALNANFYWKDTSNPVLWNGSLIYEGLQDASFYNNKDYMLEEWQDIISEANWNYGTYAKPIVLGATYDDIYNIEKALVIKAKIGIMNISDVLYTGQTEYISNNSSNTWIKLTNNDSNPVETLEFLMNSFNESSIWTLKLSNELSAVTADANTTAVIRPAFYLNSDVYLLSGTGSQSDPYIIGRNAQDPEGSTPGAEDPEGSTPGTEDPEGSTPGAEDPDSDQKTESPQTGTLFPITLVAILSAITGIMLATNKKTKIFKI